MPTPQVLAQTVYVKLDTTNTFERRDDMFLKLGNDELAHVVCNYSVCLVRHMQHCGFTVVLVAYKFKPLHECEAAGVRKQQQIRNGQCLAVWAHLTFCHHAEITFDVSADIFGVPCALSFHDVAAALLAHAGLQCVDFG